MNRRVIHVRCSYFDTVLKDLDGLAKNVAAKLEGVQYDTMVGTGLSGALVVPTLARLLGKRYLVVRKPGESTHASEPAVGDLGTRWVFVDDFLSSGETLKRVVRSVNKLVTAKNDQQGPDYQFKTKFVGVVEYHSSARVRNRWRLAVRFTPTKELSERLYGWSFI